MPYEKAPSSGAFLPLSLMYFLSGEPLHALSGVDNKWVTRNNSAIATGETAHERYSKYEVLDWCVD